MSLRSEVIRIFNELIGSSKKISELDSASTPLAGTELVEIVQGGVNKKVAASNLGSGGGGGGTWGSITGTLSDQTDLQSALNSKQDALISGTNIKTVNGTTLLGSGNLPVGTVTSVGLGVGSTGSDVNVSGSPVTGAASITLNIPTASASSRGALSSANWSEFNNKEDNGFTINTQTSSYTAAIGDERKLTQMNSASPNNFEIPPGVFAVGDRLQVTQIGDGVTTITAGVGVTLTFSAGVAAAPGKDQPLEAYQESTNIWTVWNGTPPLSTGNLTRTNGTYITITITGTPTDALLQDVNIAADLTGTVPESLGGTNRTSYTAGDILYASAANTLSVRNIFNTSPTALLHFKAGTATANTAPEKFTSGTLLTTIEAGAKEYNGDHYESTSGLNRLGRGGPLADFITDANNTGTGETDLYTYTTKASTLSVNGAKLIFDVAGTFNDITATAQLRLYFGGTLIGDTGALTVSATGGWSARAMVIRTGTTTARAYVTITTPSASTANYTTETDITGLTLTNTNIIKITGTAGGAGGGNNDITAKLGTLIYWAPASN